MKKKKLAIYILFAAALTFGWSIVCPKYVIQGDVKTQSAKPVYVKDLSSWTQINGGPKKYEKKKVYEDYKHIDVVRFLIGCLIIYLVCISAFLIDQKRIEQVD